MITVVATEEEPWLRYIWEQFTRINGLKTPWRLLSYTEGTASLNKHGSCVIEYGERQRISDSLFIPRRPVFRTDEYEWINGTLPVFPTTFMGDRQDRKYDIFFNAFVHLSRLEEWSAEQRGCPVHSYAARHPRKERSIWHTPVVNYLFNDLERIIMKACPGIIFAGGLAPSIEFSHDVDYLVKTTQLRMKQAAVDLFECLRLFTRLNLVKSLDKLRRVVAFSFSGADYWCFDRWAELERSLDVKSTYYIYARGDDRRRTSVRQWLLDPSYDIRRHPMLKDALRSLIEAGHSVGLHGSYCSAVDPDQLLREKAVLENAMCRPVTKSRQHWLNFRESATPFILASAGIMEDSTLGFNDLPGFRAGVASRYQPYDHRNQRPFSFTEIPLVLMDSHLHRCEATGVGQSLDWFWQGLTTAKNACVSVDWHQRGISKDYGWHESYRTIARQLMEVQG